jgi:Rad3-related DNA helicase
MALSTTAACTACPPHNDDVDQDKEERRSSSSYDDCYPSGDSIPFPYECPYPQQVALMDTLLQGIRIQRDTNNTPAHDHNDSNNNENGSRNTATRILCLESPTGTGKSLSLACASLAWLEYMEQQQKQQQQQQLSEEGTNKDSKNTRTSTSTSTSPTTTTTGLDWLEQWQPPKENENGNIQKQNAEQRQRVQQLEKVLHELRHQYQDLPRPRERRHNLVRQAITRDKMQAKRNTKRRRRRKLQEKQQKILLEFESDDDDDDEANETEPRNHPFSPGSPEWLLQASSSSSPSTSSHPRQIVYAARTHSQLTQFISEVRRTKWGKTIRVAALGSRSQGLCGHFEHSAKKHNNDASLA